MKISLTKSLLAVAVSGLMIAGFASAQTTTSPAGAAGPGAVDPGHPRVNQVNSRETRQQNRIANGVKNEKMTPQQTANVEQREANLQNREEKDMAKHNGHLTKREQNHLNRRESRMSRTIHRDKHSGM